MLGLVLLAILIALLIGSGIWGYRAGQFTIFPERYLTILVVLIVLIVLVLVFLAPFGPYV